MKKRNSLIAIVMVAVMAFAGLAGCSGKSESAASSTKSEAKSEVKTESKSEAKTESKSEPAADPEPAAEAGGYTIGAVCISLNAPIWIELMEYGDKCAETYDSKIIWKSAEGSLENQIALVEAFIEQDVDCIMMDPIDAKGVIPVIQEALKAGIPVITMGNLVEGGVDDELYNVCTTYPDERDVSAMTDLLIAVGGADKTYVGVMGTVGNFVSDTRQKAFEDTCAAAGAKSLVADGNWDPTTTLKVTQDMVAQAGDNYGGLYNLDDSMTLISLQATPEGYPVAGHNGEDSVYDKIESGEVLTTTLIGGAHIGYWNALTAIKLASGEKLPHQVYLKTYLVMTEETKAEYWDGKLDAKYPTLPVCTPEEAKVIAYEDAEILDSLD